MLTFGKSRQWLVVLVALMLGIIALEGHAQADSPSADTQACIVCHASPGLTMQLASGETLAVQIDPTEFSNSVHGNQLQCTACHPGVTVYPHPARNIVHPSARDIPYLMRNYANCGSCHEAEYNQYLGSAHAQALGTGKSDSAVCTDCHGVHDIGPANPADVGLPLGPSVYACAACHVGEFTQYQNSVHGKALLQDGDVNVPACVDCHGAHDTHKAKDSIAFRSQSVAMCSSCHADAKLMTKYGLSTQLLTGYLADFHGMSAMLSTNSKGESSKQAMCYDCHNAHAIQSTVSVNGLRTQETLLDACQRCHPDANANFLTAWLGHANPKPTEAALVFGTRDFYKTLIVIVGLLIVAHIALEYTRVILNTLHKRNHSHE